tara:strand:+ start:46 stop:546 length:501 start_codon:yes stop_codon:yes gene_type:complete
LTKLFFLFFLVPTVYGENNFDDNCVVCEIKLTCEYGVSIVYINLAFEKDYKKVRFFEDGESLIEERILLSPNYDQSWFYEVKDEIPEINFDSKISKKRKDVKKGNRIRIKNGVKLLDDYVSIKPLLLKINRRNLKAQWEFPTIGDVDGDTWSGECFSGFKEYSKQF